MSDIAASGNITRESTRGLKDIVRPAYPRVKGVRVAGRLEPIILPLISTRIRSIRFLILVLLGNDTF